MKRLKLKWFQFIPFKSKLKNILLKHKTLVSKVFFKECPKALFIENWEYTDELDLLPYLVPLDKKISKRNHKLLFLVEKEEIPSPGLEKVLVYDRPHPFEKEGQLKVILESYEKSSIVQQILFIYGELFIEVVREIL